MSNKINKETMKKLIRELKKQGNKHNGIKIDKNYGPFMLHKTCKGKKRKTLNKRKTRNKRKTYRKKR